MATIQNIVIDQGTTFTKVFLPIKINGQVVDLTTYTIVGHIRRGYASNEGLMFTTAVVGEATSGIISISLSATETLSLKYGRYLYDVKLVKVGEEIRAFEGIATITPTVTR